MTHLFGVPDTPPWFNLSAIIDDLTVREIIATSAEVEELLPVVKDVLDRAAKLVCQVDEATAAVVVPNDDCSEGLYELVRVYSGARRLHEAVLSIDKAVEETGLI